MGGVMMEGDELPGADPGRKGEGLPIGAVAPAETMPILLIAVLGVVDQEIDSGRKIETRDPSRVGPFGAGVTERRHVIREIGKAAAVRFDAVADGGSGMADERGPNAKWSYVEGRPRDGMTARSGQVPEV